MLIKVKVSEASSIAEKYVYSINPYDSHNLPGPALRLAKAYSLPLSGKTGVMSSRLHLLSTVKWDTSTSMASLFLTEEDFDLLVNKEEWYIMLYRTDSHWILTAPAPLSSATRAPAR